MKLRGLSLLLLCLMLVPRIVAGQGSAQIVGTVKDPMNATVAGAAVVAAEIERGITRRTATDHDGSYLLPNLSAGTYRLTISSPGFRTFVQMGVVLQINGNIVVNVALQPGQVADQTEVQANTSMADSRDPGVNDLITNEVLTNLPLFDLSSGFPGPGRNVTGLVLLTGSAVSTGPLYVAGSLGFATEHELDGALHTTSYNGQSLAVAFPDTIQELRVEKTALSATHSQAAAVSYITKSGTNAFHGDAFDFLSNDRLNARPYFAVRKGGGFKRNQFGGTVGGPIVENQLFFFGGFQGTTSRLVPNDRLAFVPTEAMLAGDFTRSASPACNAGRQIALRAPFINNRIDPTLLDRASLTVANRLPKTTDPCGALIYSQRTNIDDWQGIGRIDLQRGEKESIFGRYSFGATKNPTPFSLTPDNLLNVNTSGENDLFQVFAIGGTYVFSPRIVNTTNFGFNRLALNRTAAEFFGPADLGVNAYSYIPKAMSISVTGGFSLAGQADATARTTGYQLRNDTGIVLGAHQTSFGLNLVYSTSNRNVLTPTAFSFSGQQTGLGLADFLIGRPSLFSNAAPNQLYMRQWFPGIYGQDAWKISQRVTMTYGLRWEPFFPPTSANSRVYSFDYARFQQGIRSTVFRNAPSGFFYSGDSGFPENSGINKRWLNFGPRLGLAWDVGGDGRTSIRASYGLSYAYIPLGSRSGVGATAPWAVRFVTSPQGSFQNPWLNIAGGDLFPLKLDQNALFPPYVSFLTIPSDNQTPQISSWNITMQKQLGADFLISSSYLASQTTHVWVQKPLNPARFLSLAPCSFNGVNYAVCSTTANTDQRRRLNLERPQEAIGALDELDDSGTQSYHGLVLSVLRRATRGITVNANYTWAHCISDLADTGGSSPSAASSVALQNPDNHRLDRGNCDSDRRHLFNLYGIATTPRFENKPLRILLTGWRASGIYRRSAGSYLTIFSGLDLALDGSAGQRVNWLQADPFLDKSGRPLTQYLNPAAFVPPALGTRGTMGRANIEGPATWQFDAGMAREFSLGETQRVEFRAEAFNLTNSFRPANPDTNLASNTFGQIRSTLAPRIMLFALKYLF
jgi:Carboxypeptidase regulatory-like domain